MEVNVDGIAGTVTPHEGWKEVKENEEVKSWKTQGTDATKAAMLRWDVKWLWSGCCGYVIKLGSSVRCWKTGGRPSVYCHGKEKG